MKLCLYLVETGQITAEQALHAVRHQLAMRSPIGQIAVEAGLMTMSQVFEVLTRQLDSTKPFGQIAMDLDFLSKQQLSDIILKQLDCAPSLSSILIENGSVTAEQVAEAARRQSGSVLENLQQPNLIAREAPSASGVPSAPIAQEILSESVQQTTGEVS